MIFNPYALANKIQMLYMIIKSNTYYEIIVKVDFNQLIMTVVKK